MYLGFVQQLDRYADRARHDEFDDLRFVFGRRWIGGLALQEVDEFYGGCEGWRICQTSFVGFREALSRSVRASYLQISSSTPIILIYKKESNEYFGNVQRFQTVP